MIRNFFVFSKLFFKSINLAHKNVKKMKKSSTRRKIFKIFLKAIFLLLTSLIYILIIQSESKNLLTFRIGAKKPAIEVKVSLEGGSEGWQLETIG